MSEKEVAFLVTCFYTANQERYYESICDVVTLKKKTKFLRLRSVL